MMHYADAPSYSPYTCGLCGNGAENGTTAPFLHTDFYYVEDDGRQFRLMLCGPCVTNIARMEGSPVAHLIERGEKERPVTYAHVPANDDDLADRVVEKIIAHEKAKDEARMAKARAAKARKEAESGSIA